MTAIDTSLLSVIVFLPLAAGLGMLALQLALASLGGELPDTAWRGVGLGSTLVTFFLSLQLFAQFDPAAPGLQFVQRAEWLPAYGVHYFTGVDGISLLLVLLTTFLMPLALLGAWKEERALRSFTFFHLFLETTILGTLVAQNAFQFYVSWTLMPVPAFFLIGIWGGSDRIRAALKFLLVSLVGSLPMLIAIIAVGALHAEQFGALNFDLVAVPGAEAEPALLDTVISASAETPWWRHQYGLFGAFALAFAIAVPLFPFHTWVPDAHVEAPTAASVVLAGVLLKMGVYGFLRFALPLFPVAAEAWTPLLVGLALAGVLSGAMVALVQSDLKKLIAYTAVPHLGLVMLGVFALNEEGLQGGVLQMVNHGLVAAALFLLVGMLYERRGVREIEAFGGLARPLPVAAALFGAALMASIGLPGLGGFVGEFLILVGVFESAPGVAVAALLGVVLLAAAMLWMFRRVMFGPCDNPVNQALLDLDLREKAILTAVLVPIVWIGLYPNFFLTRVGGSVSELLHTIQVRRDLVAPSDPVTALPRRHGDGEPVAALARGSAGGEPGGRP